MTTRYRTLAATLLAFALAGAACGADTTNPAPTSSVAPATSSVPATTTPSPAVSTTTAQATTIPETTLPETTTSTPTDPAPTEPTLVLAAYHGGAGHKAWLEDAVEAFEEQHPEWNVEIRFTNLYGAAVPESLEDDWFGEPQADLISGTIAGRVTPLVEDGALLDLTDLWAEMGWNEAYAPAVTGLASVGDRRYWVPTFGQWNPVFYRTDVFDAAGVAPPETWEDLLDICDVLLDVEGLRRPMVVGGSGWTPPAARWFTTINLALNGTDFHDSLMRGEIAWTDQRVADVFARWQELIDGGCFGTDGQYPQAYSSALTLLGNGASAMYNLGEWIFEPGGLSAAAPVSFFSVPTISDGIDRGEILHTYGFAIPADSPHPEGARELLLHMVGEEMMLESYNRVRRVILNTTITPEYNERHLAGIEFIEQMDHAVVLFEVATHPDIASAALDGFVSYLRNNLTASELMGQLESIRAAIYGAAEA